MSHDDDADASASRSAPLLEREVAARAARARSSTTPRGGRGRLVFVEGEAGVGKTALLRALPCDDTRRRRAPSGAPATRSSPPARSGRSSTSPRRVGGGSQQCDRERRQAYEVAAALHARARRGAEPTILVLDDMHWADEASLDVLRLIARRVEELAALVLASYREPRGRPAHGLRLVIGELASSRAVQRLHVEPLSLARRRLAGGAVRRRCRRAPPEDRREPAVRHGGAGRGWNRDSRDRYATPCSRAPHASARRHARSSRPCRSSRSRRSSGSSTLSTRR